jgi:hypothetical protein
MAITCGEKTRLVSEYEAAAKRYSDAVTELQRKMGTSAKSEYERLSHAADEARVESEHARLAVEQHVRAHKC